jgi:molecular chaperone GrpE
MSNKEEKKENTQNECDCSDCKCDCECENDECNDCSCEDCKDCECKSDECEKLKLDLAQEKGERLSLLAEFVNYKKRVEAEKGDFVVYANNVLLKQIIEVVDDFDRALKGTDSKDKKLISLITSYGLESIEVKVGDEFSPENMEAITTSPVKDEKQHNKVVEVLQQGYINKQTGKSFKHAVVVIGKKS